MSEPTDSLETTRMTLGEHLEELRKRLFKSVLVLTIAFGLAWCFKEELSDQVMWPWRTAVARLNADLVEKFEGELAAPARENELRVERAEAALRAHPETPRSLYFTSDQPLNRELKDPVEVLPRSRYFLSDDPSDRRLRDPIDARLSAFSIGDSFFFALNVSLYFAAFLGGPFVLWQMWQFIAAGLYPKEKRLVFLYFPFSLLLFLGGVVFCYFLVIPTGMYYLANTLPVDQVKPIIGIDKYFDFLSTMCLAMGAVFQLPIVMIFLSSLGIVEPSTYSKYRGHFLIGALFVAAVVTPGPDWISQILMTIPMYVLYEVGILVSRWRARPRRHPTAAGGA